MSYNTDMSTLPVMCPSCLKEVMVEMENLETKPIDKVVSRLGVTCTSCDEWVTLSYTTRLLEDALKKLESRPTSGASYHYHFAKALKKCEGIQERYGGF